MVNLLVVRHAESVWNLDGRWQGHANPPLSPDGATQARAAATNLRDVGCIVSSDLDRARQTAEIIAESLDAGPVTGDPGWRERSVGLWQGLTTEQIERDYPGALAAGNYPSGWESDESLIERVFAAAHHIADRVPSGDALVVSHAGVIYTLERYFGCAFKRVGNLGGRRISVESGELCLQERIALTGDGACLWTAASPERR
ncbi:MAG: histidine phosphatase family protein [Acidimicrobiaceae bacterium]|nr:histidine phosphatase family protein [Acidimicrobiaceae bacterium]